MAKGEAHDGGSAACASLQPKGGVTFKCRGCTAPGYQPFNGVGGISFWIKPITNGARNKGEGGARDAAPPPQTLARIRGVVAANAEGAIEAHDLRMRHAGRLTFLEFHLVVPALMTVADAHAICDRIEAALKTEMEGLMITIHVEPEGKAKHQGVLVL
jgi:hypothetical protein